MSERPKPVTRWTPPATAAGEQEIRWPSRHPPLEGCAPISIEDFAPSKWTRQSTAAQDPAGFFALPTEPERSPWWEIDLGKSVAIEMLTAWIAPIDPAAQI